MSCGAALRPWLVCAALALQSGAGGAPFDEPTPPRHALVHLRTALETEDTFVHVPHLERRPLPPPLAALLHPFFREPGRLSEPFAKIKVLEAASSPRHHHAAQVAALFNQELPPESLAAQAEARIGALLDLLSASAAGLSVLFRLEDLPSSEMTEPPFAELLGPFLPLAPVKQTAHIYLSSPGAAAHGNHTDPYEVLTLQLHGRKRWQLWRCSEAGPGTGHGGLGHEASAATAAGWRCPDDPGEELELLCETCGRHEVLLAPGDALGLPMRTVHSAHAEGGLSAHLTVSGRPPRTHVSRRRLFSILGWAWMVAWATLFLRRWSRPSRKDPDATSTSSIPDSVGRTQGPDHPRTPGVRTRPQREGRRPKTAAVE